MGWRCAIQIKGLTIGEPKPGQKHRMPLSKAAKEAGYERASRSVTLDKSRSYMNIYNGFMSGEECAKMMEEEASFVKIRMKDGTTSYYDQIMKKMREADSVQNFGSTVATKSEDTKSGEQSHDASSEKQAYGWTN